MEGAGLVGGDPETSLVSVSPLSVLSRDQKGALVELCERVFYFVENRPQFFGFNTSSERPFSKLLKNHKINVIGPTELKLWSFKDSSFNAVSMQCTYTNLSCPPPYRGPSPLDPPLFYQPGKIGFYAPRVATNTPERLNAYRNIGRLIGLCLLHTEVMTLPLCRHVFKFLLRREVWLLNCV